MFTPEERDRIRARLVERAHGDERIVAAAAVGGSATGGDRWSDLDLSFAVRDDVPVETVLADWTAAMIHQLGAAALFDLTAGAFTYRVFLLPGALQVDLSFAPAAQFAARGPRFALLFGEAGKPAHALPPPPGQELGLGAHHVVRAFACLERGRPWQALYWIEEARAHAQTLACHHHGLDTAHARGFDGLPKGMLRDLEGTLVGTLDPAGLRRALSNVTALLLREGGACGEPVEQLGELLAHLRQAG